MTDDCWGFGLRIAMIMKVDAKNPQEWLMLIVSPKSVYPQMSTIHWLVVVGILPFVDPDCSWSLYLQYRCYTPPWTNQPSNQANITLSATTIVVAVSKMQSMVPRVAQQTMPSDDGARMIARGPRLHHRLQAPIVGHWAVRARFPTSN